MELLKSTVRGVVRAGIAISLFGTAAPLGCSAQSDATNPTTNGGSGGFNSANGNVASGAGVRWVQVPGWAADVAAGGDGELWVTGQPISAGGDYPLYKRVGNDWTGISGAGTAIDVGDDDDSFVVANSGGGIWRRSAAGNTWSAMPGGAIDVGVGADRSTWIVGTDHNVYRWTGADWELHPAGANRIDVDPDGVPWVINPAGNIFRLNAGGGWDQMPGLALDIGIGATGDVFIAGTDGQTYRWQGENWILYTGANVTRMSADAFGAMYAVTNSGGLFRETAAPLGPTALGCFADSANRDLGVQLPGDTYTVETCSAACGGAGYKYAGLQYYGFCFCGNTYGLYGPSGGCTTPCSQNGAESCGGSWANSVYQVDLQKLTGFVLNGQQVGCNATESLPGSYDINCGPGKLSLSGLHGIIRSTSDFSLGGTVGGIASQLGQLGAVVDFVNGNIVTGLDNAFVRVDGPAQGTRLTANAQVGLGSAFDGLSQSIQDITGVSLASLRPKIRLRYEQNRVRVDSLLYEGNVPYTIPQIGTGFTLKSLRLAYDSTKGSKSLTVQADTNLRPSANDGWVPTKLTLVREVSGGTENITGSAHISGWNNPFGFVPVNVVDADLAVGFTNRKLAAYRIQINQATATSYSGTYTLAGDYAVDRENQLFAFNLTTDRVPLTLLMQMLVGNDPGMLSVFQALKLDQTMIHGSSGQPVVVSLSPTGGTILGHTYEKRSHLYGALDVVIGSATIPGTFDLTGDVSVSNGKFTVGDFTATVSIDLAGFTNMLKSQSTAAADILNAFSVKSVALKISRTGSTWAGGAQATLHLCGADQSLAFDTNNVPKLITDGVAFISNTVQACINNATCPAGYEKGGALCYPVCAPGYYSDGATTCYPACPTGSSPSPGFCNYPFGSAGACPSPLTGLKPSCINSASSYSRGAGVPVVYPP